MQINEITFINLEFNATLSFVFFGFFNKHRIVRSIFDYNIPNYALVKFVSTNIYTIILTLLIS